MVAFSRLGHTAGLSRAAGTALLLVVSLATVATLSGCTDPADPTPTRSPASVSTHTPKVTPTATPTPTDPPTPVALTCEQVVTAEQLYEFNPNYGADPGYTPADGSNAAAAVAAKGVACGYLNQTSNAVIEVAIAKPAASALVKLKDAAISDSTVVPTYGVPPAVEGYFGTRNNAGQAQIFSNGYWVVLQSKDFAEPGDPQPLVAAVLANLPQG